MAPRLKPIADEKELAAVPLDEPVLVELEPAAPVAENDDEPEQKPALRVVEKDEPTDGAAKLEKQLLASQEASRLDRERADRAERERDEARQESERLRTSSADTEKELINTSLAGAQAAQAAAKAAHKIAFEAGDPDAMADAAALIARAATDIRNYEGAVAQFDNDQTAEREPVRQEQNQDTSIEAAIDRDPKLLGPERDWLKSHTEVLTDPKVNRKLGVAYDEALEKGLRRGTPQYFEFLDQRIGYAEAETGGDNNRNDERASIVAAPVSRDNRSSTTGQRTSPTQVRLTPEQREMAMLSGVSDTEYARGLLQMEADKRANPERYSTR